MCFGGKQHPSFKSGLFVVLTLVSRRCGTALGYGTQLLPPVSNRGWLLRFQAGGARLSTSEQQQLKVHYSERGMNHLLHRLGYVYKKSQLVP